MDRETLRLIAVVLGTALLAAGGALASMPGPTPCPSLVEAPTAPVEGLPEAPEADSAGQDLALHEEG